MVYSNELYHFGRSKRDGAPRGSGRYPLGSGARGQKTSSASSLSDDDLKKSVQRMNLEKQYNKLNAERAEKSPLETTKKVLDEGSNAVNRLRNMNGDNNRRVERERMNLDHMTDKELRDAINRENLEIQYSNLFGPEKSNVTKGQERVSQILDVSGNVLAVGSSALAIALAIKSLMRG